MDVTLDDLIQAIWCCSPEWKLPTACESCPFQNEDDCRYELGDAVIEALKRLKEKEATANAKSNTNG